MARLRVSNQSGDEFHRSPTAHVPDVGYSHPKLATHLTYGTTVACSLKALQRRTVEPLDVIYTSIELGGKVLVPREPELLHRAMSQTTSHQRESRQRDTGFGILRIATSSAASYGNEDVKQAPDCSRSDIYSLIEHVSSASDGNYIRLTMAFKRQIPCPPGPRDA